MMTSGLEIAANPVNALSIFLAARNSMQTWWVGVIGCAVGIRLDAVGTGGAHEGEQAPYEWRDM